MPMSFPDFGSLRSCASRWKFRAPSDSESEQDFRAALADYVQSRDLVESMEIRTSVGWDKFSASQNSEMLLHALNRDGD